MNSILRLAFACPSVGVYIDLDSPFPRLYVFQTYSPARSQDLTSLTCCSISSIPANLGPRNRQYQFWQWDVYYDMARVKLRMSIDRPFLSTTNLPTPTIFVIIVVSSKELTLDELEALWLGLALALLYISACLSINPPGRWPATFEMCLLTSLHVDFLGKDDDPARPNVLQSSHRCLPHKCLHEWTLNYHELFGTRNARTKRIKMKRRNIRQRRRLKSRKQAV